MKSQKPYMCPIIIGILLVLIGLIIRVPGGALTTYKSLDGESAGGYYAFDNRYSSIDEYVGGDAYNYIIGASLVAGKNCRCDCRKGHFHSRRSNLLLFRPDAKDDGAIKPVCGNANYQWHRNS